MEAKQARHEHSVAKFASIALLHLSLDKKKKTSRNGQRRARLSDSDDDSTAPQFDAQTITLQQLMLLKHFFERHGGCLSEDQFVHAFQQVGSRMTTTHLRWWFKRIDADDSGSIDWHELSSFIISGTVDESGHIVSHDEHPEDAMFAKEEKGVSMPATEASANAIAGFNHSDFVTSIYCHPRIGKYFTASQDGTVRVWDVNTLEFEYILHQGKWITSMCASPDDTQLFIAGLDRSITVYELGNLSKAPRCYVGNILDEHHRVPKGRPIHRFEIMSRNIPEAPSRSTSGAAPGASPTTNQKGNFRAKETLEQFRLRNERIRYRQIPDQTVEAHVLRQMEFPAMVISCVPDSDVLFIGLNSGRLQGYPIVHRSLLRGRFVDCTIDVCPHENYPVTTLLWADFFDGFLSTASDGSVALTNVLTKVVVKVGVAATPIYHAVWMEAPKLLATCGASRDISLWSASPQQSTMTLTGHFCSVVQLAYDANDNWLVSVDAERMIVIWNMHNMQPIQSMTDYDDYQLKRFSCMRYDLQRNRIVCASTAPVIFTKGTTSVPLADPGYKGHQRPIVGCLYNRIFHQIITADSECIKIWDVLNGHVRACVSVPSLRATGVPIKFAGGGSITSIRLDSSHRRLIIGLSSATICVMSISNCHLVLECHRSTPKLLPAVDSGACCFIPQPSSQLGKKGFALIVGNKVLMWEDKESVSSVGIQREINFHMHKSQFEMLATHQQTPLPMATMQSWRSPQPICISSCEGIIAVGTDCGVVLLYSTTSSDTTGFVGVYDPKVLVTGIAWHDPSHSIVFSLSNGRLMFTHRTHRNKQIAIVHQDDGGTPVAALSADVGFGHIAVGDEDGTVHTWKIHDIEYDHVKPFTTQVIDRDRGRRVIEYIASFRAHMGEVSTVVVVPPSEHEMLPPLVATASSDCQCRLFTLGGLFVGYVGAPWKVAVASPRSALRTIPAPIQDLKTSKSFLRHFLQGMSPDQEEEPYEEDMNAAVEPPSTAAPRPKILEPGVASSGKGAGRGLLRDTSSAAFGTMLSEVHSGLDGVQISTTPLTSPSSTKGKSAALTPMPPISPRRQDNPDGSGSAGVESGGVQPYALPLVSPAAANNPSSNINFRAKRSGDHNPLIRTTAPRAVPHPKVHGEDDVTRYSTDSTAFSQGLSAPVTLAGKHPVPGLSLSALMAPSNLHGGAGGSTTPSTFSRSKATRSKSQVEFSSSPSQVLSPSSHKSPRNISCEASSGQGQEVSIGGATSDDFLSSSLSALFTAVAPPDATTVAAMVPLLHLDRVPKSLLRVTTTIEEEARGVSGRGGEEQQPHSSRLDEWRSRHRLWAAEQSSGTNMIKSARPMTLVRVQDIDSSLEQRMEASLKAQRRRLAEENEVVSVKRRMRQQQVSSTDDEGSGSGSDNVARRRYGRKKFQPHPPLTTSSSAAQDQLPHSDLPHAAAAELEAILNRLEPDAYLLK